MLKLNTLTEADLSGIFDRVFTEDTVIMQSKVTFDNDARELLVRTAAGDARKMLNLVELCVSAVEPGTVIDREQVASAYKTASLYDRGGERHYDTISAFIKSVRGSDPDAAVYYSGTHD